jgi:hypothetical protein
MDNLSNRSNRLHKLREFFGPSDNSGRSFEWWIFPSVDRPRVIIPTNPLYWASGLNFISSPKKRFGLKILLLARRILRQRADFKFQGSLPVVLSQHLRGDARTLEHLSIYVATSNRFSKYTLALLDSSARVLGFAKIAEGQDAEEAIRNEVNALTVLADEFPGSPSFPIVFHHEKGVSIQSPAPQLGYGALAYNAGKISSQLFRSHLYEVTWLKSASRAKLLEALEELMKSGRSDISKILEKIDLQLTKKFENYRIREGLTHGDFVSWNMADSLEGFVFDWEWMEQRAEYHDLFHFLWMRNLQSEETAKVSKLLARWSSADAIDLLKGYQPDGQGPLYGDALLYLTISFAFYSRHCVANGDDPLAFPFMVAILQNIRKFAELDERMAFQSTVMHNVSNL